MSEFGQCPIQLFTKKHPERRPRDLSQIAVRLSSADFILSDLDAKSLESIPKNDRGIVVSHLHTFEDNPIMWVHMDKKSLRIIFKNRDLFDIPYEITVTSPKPFQWSKKKDKTGYLNLGKVIFDDFNISNQVKTFGAKNSENSYMVIGGYQDNSFKIFNKQIGIGLEGTIKQSINFHKVRAL